MKIIFLLLAFLLTIISFGQNKEKAIKTIDSIVKVISKDKKYTTSYFRIQALKKVLHYISYTYKFEKKNILRIERKFSHKQDSIKQIFYLNNGQLIYAIETIVSHFANDSITWSGDFYFSNGKLLDYETLGHGKSEIETWDPESDILRSYSESKRDIIRHQKSKNFN